MNTKQVFIIIIAAILALGANAVIMLSFVGSYSEKREMVEEAERQELLAFLATPPPTTDKPLPSRASAVGEMVGLGGYDWYVMEIVEDKALLLSVYITETRIYHGPEVLTKEGPKYEELQTTWADCQLRAYLNGEFLGRFSEDERALILETRNVNPPNPWYYGEISLFDDAPEGGPDTTDRIFILSLDEVVKYFGDSGQLENRPVSEWGFTVGSIDDEYNTARMAYDTVSWGGVAASWWWLRSPGSLGGYAAYVSGGLGYGYGSDSGSIDITGGGSSVSGAHYGIRPALWLNL
jgi:hypothetical protein